VISVDGEDGCRHFEESEARRETRKKNSGMLTLVGFSLGESGGLGGYSGLGGLLVEECEQGWRQDIAW